MIKAPALAFCILLSACASVAPLDPAEEAAQAVIPFANSNGIQEWKVVSGDSLYIQGQNGDWFFVRTMGECPRLRTASTLGFDTAGLDRFDRFSAILAEGQRCPVASVVRSSPPPRKD